jgi:hypothetical protein
MGYRLSIPYAIDALLAHLVFTFRAFFAFHQTLERQAVAVSYGSPERVTSTALFEMECRSPRQMMIANAFCSFFEKAQAL